MLLMIDQPQVGLTAPHYTPQTRTNAGDSGSWRLTADPASAAKSGYRSGYRLACSDDGLLAAAPVAARPI